MERDVEIQDLGEILEDESEDGSPDTNQDMDDLDSEEEVDHSMFNFDEEPLEDKDEDQTDVGDEERNIPEDQPISEQTKTNSKADVANNVTKSSINTHVSLSPTEI